FSSTPTKLNGFMESLHDWRNGLFIKMTTFGKGLRPFDAGPEETITKAVTGFCRLNEPTQFMSRDMRNNRDMRPTRLCRTILRHGSQIARIPGLPNDGAQCVSITPHHSKGAGKFRLQYE